MNGMPGTLIGALRGPLLLITLGVLFAVDYQGAYGFHRTWPVLIIVFGVMKLLERTFARRAAGPGSTGGNVP